MGLGYGHPDRELHSQAILRLVQLAETTYAHSLDPKSQTSQAVALCRSLIMCILQLLSAGLIELPRYTNTAPHDERLKVAEDGCQKRVTNNYYYYHHRYYYSNSFFKPAKERCCLHIAAVEQERWE